MGPTPCFLSTANPGHCNWEPSTKPGSLECMIKSQPLLCCKINCSGSKRSDSSNRRVAEVVSKKE